MKERTNDNDFIIELENMSNSSQDIALFTLGKAGSIISNQYRCYAVYQSMYLAGTYWRLKINGVDYSGTLAADKTPAQLAAIFTALGFGTYNIASNIISGYNMFYTNSQTYMPSELEITYAVANPLFRIDNTGIGGTLDEIITVTGNAGFDITIDWGDSTTDIVTLTGINQIIPHSYASFGIYNINISGNVDELTHITMNNQQMTLIAIPASFVGLTEFYARNNPILVSLIVPDTLAAIDMFYADNCALDVTSINDILVSIDNAGSLGTDIIIDGGTNAAPSGAGIAAKTNLLINGWNVITN
jgi:hypothetical protein